MKYGTNHPMYRASFFLKQIRQLSISELFNLLRISVELSTIEKNYWWRYRLIEHNNKYWYKQVLFWELSFKISITDYWIIKFPGNISYIVIVETDFPVNK